MRQQLSAPLRFGRFLAARLSGDRKNNVQAKLVDAQGRLGERESALAERLAIEQPEKSDSSKSDGWFELGTSMLDPFGWQLVGGLAKVVLRAVEFGLDVLGAVLDGLTSFDV